MLYQRLTKVTNFIGFLSFFLPLADWAQSISEMQFPKPAPELLPRLCCVHGGKSDAASQQINEQVWGESSSHKFFFSIPTLTSEVQVNTVEEEHLSSLCNCLVWDAARSCSLLTAAVFCLVLDFSANSSPNSKTRRVFFRTAICPAFIQRLFLSPVLPEAW